MGQLTFPYAPKETLNSTYSELMVNHLSVVRKCKLFINILVSLINTIGQPTASVSIPLCDSCPL